MILRVYQFGAAACQIVFPVKYRHCKCVCLSFPNLGTVLFYLTPAVLKSQQKSDCCLTHVLEVLLPVLQSLNYAACLSGALAPVINAKLFNVTPISSVLAVASSTILRKKRLVSVLVMRHADVSANAWSDNLLTASVIVLSGWSFHELLVAWINLCIVDMITVMLWTANARRFTRFISMEYEFG